VDHAATVRTGTADALKQCEEDPQVKEQGMRTLGTTTAALVATLAFATGLAIADDLEWPASEYGIAITAGGGVQDFADDGMQSTTDAGGTWDVRGILGTRTMFAFEAAYIGSAQAIDSKFGEEATATLFGNGVEGALRLNVLPYAIVTPYAFGGLGWKRYDVSGKDFTTADAGIDNDDSLLEFPFGGGLSYRDGGFIADGRFTYRVASGEDLVASSDRPTLEEDPDTLSLDTWSVSARAGWEY
jgi:hypothetical protein